MLGKIMYEEYKPLQIGTFTYYISNLGNIKNARGKILKFRDINGAGYERVILRKNRGEKQRYFVHRLVATAFIHNPNNYNQVNHIDGNKRNNCVNNLEWCTGSQNTIHWYYILHNRKSLNYIKQGIYLIQKYCKKSKTMISQKENIPYYVVKNRIKKGKIYLSIYNFIKQKSYIK